MESISVFDIIKVGVGPSSSHTMGPWKAAELFLAQLDEDLLKKVTHLKVTLYGSLAKTGKGHGTDVAVMLGLLGMDYKTIDTNKIHNYVDKLHADNNLLLKGKHRVEFIPARDIVFNFDLKKLSHPNLMSFGIYQDDKLLLEKKYQSLGGGFVAEEGGGNNVERIPSKYPCHSASDIFENCKNLKLSVSELIFQNELSWLDEKDIYAQCFYLWNEMKQCIYRGINNTGILPGGLHVKRRAADLNLGLLKENTNHSNADEWVALVKNTGRDFVTVNKWVSCFALAVNEENAAFGRIITAPTNGAAGVIPAVLMYAHCYLSEIDNNNIVKFILTAGEIGTLYKKKATISAAMGGCQAEIGVSSSMAAAGLTEIMGGTPEQVLQAAEIAMEHHLGLTCDPVGGLVQIPCIERNAMGAIKAITAAYLAMESKSKEAIVSLDDVIATMWEIAQDMNQKYKETSEGGLATHISVNVVEC
jgi:L-serine dehydratase